MQSCNKKPCSKPYVVNGAYAGGENLYCIPENQKYILVMECVNACAPDGADPFFYYVDGGPHFCNLGTSSWWEACAFERFKCKCIKQCLNSPGGPVVIG